MEREKKKKRKKPTYTELIFHQCDKQRKQEPRQNSQGKEGTARQFVR